MLCNVFCSWFLFCRPMNFNNFFFSSSLQKHWVFHSVSLHCRIVFLLLPFRTPIATCPVEKQSCETQSKMETAEGMSISSYRLRGQFFFLRGKIRLMSNLRSNEPKCAEDNLCWVTMAEVGVNIKMCWIRHETAVLKSMSTYLNSPAVPWYEYIWQLPLIFLLASNQPTISQRMPRVSIRIH